MMICLGVVLMASGNTNSVVYAEPIPVIYDSDLGSDIDDTWALAFILACPELDLKMVVTDSHDTVSRAKITAKFLERVKRDDVPIGIGVKEDERKGPQHAWAKDYDLEEYYGEVHEDGVQAMIDMIMDSEEKITLFVVGPCPNIEEALEREPRIVEKVEKVIAMSGSIHIGYGGKTSPDAEYNVRDNVSAARAMYTADWDLTIAPLDTAGLVSLRGEKYQKLFHDMNPLVETLIENYRVWAEEGNHRVDPSVRSSTLFDTVAIYLAFDESLCTMEDLRLVVEQTGYTRINSEGKLIRAAMEWKDLEEFEDLLVERLKKGVAHPFKKPESNF